jgi:hypothetical protein
MLASKQGKIAIGTEQEVRDGGFSLKVDNADCRLVKLNRESALRGAKV